MNIHPVILCGGAGTRLWPLSRESNPKQFLPLLRGESPFAATLGRLRGLDCAEPLIVTQSEHLFRVREQVRQAGLTEGPVHLEPFGRGTAPAVAIAAYRLLDQDPQAALLVLPSDHDIPDPAAFQEAVMVGIQALEQGRLVVFGLTAQSPETGFGYMEQGAELAEAPGCHQVLRFIEKPEIEIARGLVASGRHHWNSGIFLFGAAAFLAEMEHLEPELAAACRQVADGGRLDGQAFAINPDQFARCRNVSVDHAILERTGLTAMVPADFPWSDMGTWDALWAAADKDAQGNSAHGDVQLHGVSNSYVHATKRMVVGIGISDVVVVETADAVLVASRDQAQHVKDAVEQLRTQARDECRTHRQVARPWGHYEDIDAGERFRVKRITVTPGGRLSLQLHHHRAEHWVVVRGTARVTRGDKVSLLHENQSTYIPEGVVHRLENPGKIPLEVIETQTGSYLKEDDIVRLEDVYARS